MGVQCSGAAGTATWLACPPTAWTSPLGPDAERRARHEAAMLERLLGVAGVAQLAEQRRYPGAVVLEDAGRASLAGMTKPLPVDSLVGSGLGLARAVAGMHLRGVVHRDITPANAVVADDGTACLAGPGFRRRG